MNELVNNIDFFDRVVHVNVNNFSNVRNEIDLDWNVDTNIPDWYKNGWRAPSQSELFTQQLHRPDT